MSFYFVGSAISDFDEAANALVNTGAGTVIAPYVSEGIFGEDSMTVKKFLGTGNGPTGDFWYSWWTYGSSFGAHNCYVDFYDEDFSDTQPVLRVQYSITGGAPTLRIWNGTSFDTVATGTSFGSTLQKIDIQYVRDDSAGIFRLYVDGVLNAEATGIDTNRAAWTDLNILHHHEDSSAGGDDYCVSGMIWADVDTRLLKIVQGTGLADGTHSEWSGGAAEVDETGIPDTDSAVSQSADQRMTFTDSLDAIIDTDHDILASVISIRGRAVGSPPAAKPLYRSGGTDYAGTAKTLPATNRNTQFVQETDPDTGVAWTPAGIEAAEHGLQSSAA